MLDSAELCINVENYARKNQFDLQHGNIPRPCARAKAKPLSRIISCPPESIPGVLGVTGAAPAEVLGQLSTFFPCCSSSARPMGAARKMRNVVFSHAGSAEKESWEGVRRIVLADFGTWREDRGVEHLASVFPFLPASDYPHLTFLPRDGGCRAAVDV